MGRRWQMAEIKGKDRHNYTLTIIRIQVCPEKWITVRLLLGWDWKPESYSGFGFLKIHIYIYICIITYTYIYIYLLFYIYSSTLNVCC